MSIEQDFKDALAGWGSGVTVVTAKTDEGVYGLTVSSFTSVSLDPPLVCVCLANSNRLPAMIQTSGTFAISVLARDQEAISNHYATPGREPTSQLEVGDSIQTSIDIPVLTGGAAYLCCEVFELVAEGDHTIAVGRVVEAVSDESKEPLIYFRRKYRGVSD